MTLKWTYMPDQDNGGAELWALVDDGTPLYVIKRELTGGYELIQRDDARQPNAGYDHSGEAIFERPLPDDHVAGPFDTLEKAKLAYLLAAFP